MPRSLLLLILALWVSAAASAQGPKYRHVAFITSATFGVNGACEPDPLNPNCFGGHLSADYQMNEYANAAGMYADWNGSNPTWKAVISTATFAAKDYVPIGGPVYNVQGDLLAVDAADFWDGSILSGVKYNEYGMLLPSNSTFWTGCNQLGEGSQTCSSWSSTSGQANVGLSQATTNWLNQAQLTCSQPKRLLAMSPLILEGDFDDDNDVDGRDFLIWQRYADAQPGTVPEEERRFAARIKPAGGLAAWQESFGVVVNPPEIVAVPEPSALAMLCVGSLLILRDSRRARG